MRTLLLLLVALAVASPRPGAAAGAVVVPDDHATLTAAIAAGADTVWVRDGIYDEVVVVPRPLLLARYGPGVLPVEHPNVTGLVVPGGPEGWVRVVELRVLQAVQFPSAFPGPSLWLENCVLEGGITRDAGMGPGLRVTGCEVTGDVAGVYWSLEFTGNTMTGGGLNADFEAFATISSNWITGAPGFGITLRDNDSEGVIADNVVTDCGGGIRVIEPGSTPIDRNRIEHCSGDGIHVVPGGQSNSAHFTDNVLRDIGGDGLVFGSLGGTAIGNTIEQVAHAGIRIPASTVQVWRIAGNRIVDTGESGVEAMDGYGSVTVFAGNTILRAGGLGAMLYNVTRADSNVIGRCLHDGLRVYDTNAGSGAFSASHNTFYLNGGSGLTVDTNDPGAVTANIGYGNGLYALDWTALGAATLACNLGYGNLAGNLHGVEPGETDREGNPLFCDLPADDVHLGPGSAAIFPGCETAGTLGPGCTEIVGVAGAPPLASLRAGPQPARASVRFEWAADAPARLEVFDLAGAKRWECPLPAGAGAFEWNLRDARGRPLAPGVYFARATSAERTSTVKLVVAH